MAGKSNWREQCYWTIGWTIKTLANSYCTEIDRAEDAFNSGGSGEVPDLTQERAIESVQSFV
jgi:hypothetical protein